MKRVYIIFSAIAASALLLFAANRITNRHTVKVAYSVDKEYSKFTAFYPQKVSDAVLAHVSEWTRQAIQRTGQLPGTVKLKFSNGATCQLSAEGRNMEIIADLRYNDSTALARLKQEYNEINGFIITQTR